MYICLECGTTFENPAFLQEKHGFSSPPYETVSVCPRCKTTNYKKEENKYCHCCGARLKAADSSYCSERCKIRGEKLWQKEMKRKKLLNDSQLYQLVREVEEYNRKNKTKLSYGQYVTLVKSQKKRNRKNAKK